MAKPAARVAGRSGAKQRANGADGYTAYALAADGSRRALNAEAIVVDTGAGRFRIDLRAITPMMAGRLHVRVEGDDSLTLGPGDGNSTYLGVFRAREEDKTS